MTPDEIKAAEDAAAKIEADAAAAKTEAEAAAAKALAEAERKVESGEATDEEAEQWLKDQFAEIKKQMEDSESRTQQRIETTLENLKSFFRESLEQTRTLLIQPPSLDPEKKKNQSAEVVAPPSAESLPPPAKRRAYRI